MTGRHRVFHLAAHIHLRDADHNSDNGGRFSWLVRAAFEYPGNPELDRAYESTIKGRPDAKQNSDPWADVRPAPAAAAKNKQK